MLCLPVWYLHTFGSYLGDASAGVLLRSIYILANETDGEPGRYKYDITGLNYTTSYCYTIQLYDGKRYSELEQSQCVHVVTDIKGMHFIQYSLQLLI